MNVKKNIIGKNTLLLIAGILVIILGLIPIGGGAAILIFNRGADADGYHWSGTYEARTSTYACVVKIPSLSTVSLYARLGAALFGDDAISAVWGIKPVDTSNDLFSGISKITDSSSYISEFEHEEAVWEMESPFNPGIDITPTGISGESRTGSVESAFRQQIWVGASLGRQATEIEYQPVWKTGDEDKYLIIMNGDYTSEVKADIRAGYKMPVFSWLPYRLIPLGILIIPGGILILRKSHRKI